MFYVNIRAWCLAAAQAKGFKELVIDSSLCYAECLDFSHI